MITIADQLIDIYCSDNTQMELSKKTGARKGMIFVSMPDSTGCCDAICSCCTQKPKSKSLSFNLSELDVDIESLISTTEEYTGPHDGAMWNIKKKTKNLSTVVVHWCDPRTNKLRETVVIVKGGSRATIEQFVSRAQEGRFRTNTTFELPTDALGESKTPTSMAGSFFGATGDAFTQAISQDRKGASTLASTCTPAAPTVFKFLLVVLILSILWQLMY